MLAVLSMVWIFGSFYGFLYPVVVGATLALCARVSRRFRPRPRDWLPLATVPALTYYALAYLVSERQGWNIPMAVGALAAFGLLVVLVAAAARRPTWLRAGAVVGVAAAVAIWRLVPHMGMTRLF